MVMSLYGKSLKFKLTSLKAVGSTQVSQFKIQNSTALTNHWINLLQMELVATQLTIQFGIARGNFES